MTANVWLAIVFGAWVTTLIAFSFAYHRIYRRDPSSFLFNVEAAVAQREQYRLKLTDTIKHITVQRQFLEAYDQICPSGDAWTLERKAYLVGDFKFSVEVRVRLALMPEASQSWRTVIVLDSENRKVGSISEHIRLDRELLRLAKQQRRAEQLLDAATTTFEVWSYWDFLYFSTITQTTVGYGDVLPNRTLVRMIVVAQIILGLVLLGVAINVVLPT